MPDIPRSTMNVTSPTTTPFILSNEVSRISRWINPVTITFSLVVNILNMVILSRRTLRSSSCTHYLLALSPANIIYMFSSPLTGFLNSQFGKALYSIPIGCRILYFNIYGSSLFVTLMLICATIDRFLASSSSVRFRRFSEVRIARRVIILTTVITALYSSPFSLIYYWNYSTDQCLLDSSTVITVYLSSRIVLYYLVCPLTMAIFGLLTIYNIRSQTTRVAAMISNAGRQSLRRRTEGQLARMLIMQVGLYVLFSVPSAVTYTMTTFIPSTNTSFMNAIRSITLVWQQGTYVSTFFLYILSAKIYREELRRVFKLHCLWPRTVREVTERVIGQYRLTVHTETRPKIGMIE